MWVSKTQELFVNSDLSASITQYQSVDQRTASSPQSPQSPNRTEGRRGQRKQTVVEGKCIGHSFYLALGKEEKYSHYTLKY